MMTALGVGCDVAAVPLSSPSVLTSICLHWLLSMDATVLPTVPSRAKPEPVIASICPPSSELLRRCKPIGAHWTIHSCD
jgi:hypothetical protein